MPRENQYNYLSDCSKKVTYKSYSRGNHYLKWIQGLMAFGQDILKLVLPEIELIMTQNCDHMGKVSLKLGLELRCSLYSFAWSHVKGYVKLWFVKPAAAELLIGSYNRYLAEILFIQTHRNIACIFQHPLSALRYVITTESFDKLSLVLFTSWQQIPHEKSEQIDGTFHDAYHIRCQPVAVMNIEKNTNITEMEATNRSEAWRTTPLKRDLARLTTISAFYHFHYDQSVNPCAIKVPWNVTRFVIAILYCFHFFSVDYICWDEEFKCENDKKCIPWHWFCDGDRDCKYDFYYETGGFWFSICNLITWLHW